jgi:protein-tyrosine phosphatase
MDKIDIHCHILPKLDDGSASVRESLEMIRMAASQGIKAVIATPHYSARFRNDKPDQIKHICYLFENTIRQKFKMDFQVYPGQEILYSEDVTDKLEAGRLLTMAGSSYVLTEFFPDVPYSSLYRAVRELVTSGYWPIIAHVERYLVARQDGRLQELIDAGAYLQMNYSAVGGKWYNETTRWCRKMLQEGYISFLGTDMHNTKERCPKTKEAEAWMKKHLDSQYMEDICRGNAQCILTNTRI